MEFKTRLARERLALLCLSVFFVSSVAQITLAVEAAEAPKPKIAIFPLAGSAADEFRDKIGFSLRVKLDRTGKYEVIDGPTMKDLASASPDPVKFGTDPKTIQDLTTSEKPDVLVWGDVTGALPGVAAIHLNILDLRQKDAHPREISRELHQPTDMRFVSEDILQSLPGVGTFAHPSEEGVNHDADSDALWEKNPNLVADGAFDEPGKWQGIYMAEKYPVRLSDDLPDTDKVVIYRAPNHDGGTPNNVLAMNLDKNCAENNGLACLSDPIPIKPDTRYRLQFRYRSDGPTLHVFIKGYALLKGIDGKTEEREVYRRQVPPSGSTQGEWVTVLDDLNPQHIQYPIDHLRIDLYAYLTPGSVMFDDVVLKDVGTQTRHATDDAIKKPVKVAE